MHVKMLLMFLAEEPKDSKGISRGISNFVGSYPFFRQPSQYCDYIVREAEIVLTSRGYRRLSKYSNLLIDKN